MRWRPGAARIDHAQTDIRHSAKRTCGINPRLGTGGGKSHDAASGGDQETPSTAQLLERIGELFGPPVAAHSAASNTTPTARTTADLPDFMSETGNRALAELWNEQAPVHSDALATARPNPPRLLPLLGSGIIPDCVTAGRSRAHGPAPTPRWRGRWRRAYPAPVRPTNQEWR